MKEITYWHWRGAGREAQEPRPSRRRPQGVRVSRQRHGDTTFVVSSPAPADPHAAAAALRSSKSRLRFVHNGVADPIVWTPTVNQQHAASAQGDRSAAEEDGHKKPDVLCFRTEDSTWCFQPSSADLACEQLGIWNRICHQMRVLPVWSTYRVPKYLSEATASHLKTGLDLAPELFYPLDKEGLLSWNPLRETERYIWIPKSSAILTSCLMMGSLFEDVRLGRTNSLAFSALDTAACQVLNAMIDAKERTQTMGQQAAMIICNMALAANLRGNNGNWRTHVLGLKALMDKWCDWRELDDSIACNAIYLADVEGALASGQAPILAFQRRFPSIELSLASEKLSSLQQSLKTLTLAARLPAATREMLVSTCTFTHLVLHAKTVKATYHPHHVSEEFWSLNYGLILHPTPLFPDCGKPALGTDQSMWTIPKLGAKSGSWEARTSLDASVRLAALLYVREPMAEVVFSRSSYPQMLSLLAVHLAALLKWARERGKPNEDLEDKKPVQVNDFPKDTQPEQKWHTNEIMGLQAVRPFLIWASVLGHLYATRMGVYALCGCVFQDVILELSHGVVTKLTKEDLALFQLLDMKYVSVGEWDPTRTLQHIVDQRF